MGCSCFRLFQYMIAVFLLLSTAMYITSGAVNYWWVTNIIYGFRTEIGLWKGCSSSPISSATVCVNRDDVLEFEKDGRNVGFNKDIVLASLIAGALFTLIPLIFVAITMCERYPSKWKLLIASLFLFLGVGAGIFGTVWALVKISSNFQGWAFFCLYGGVGLGVISCVLLIVLLMCMQAPGAYRTTTRGDEIAMMAR